MDWVVDVAMVVGTLLMIAIGMTIYMRLNPTRPKVGRDQDSPVKLSPKVRTPADSDEEEEDNAKGHQARKVDYPKNARLSVPEDEDEEEEAAQAEGLDPEILKELKLLEEINQAKRKEKGKGKNSVVTEESSKGVEKKHHVEAEGSIKIEPGLEEDVLEMLEAHSVEESKYGGEILEAKRKEKGGGKGEKSVVIEESLKGAEKKHRVEEEDSKIETSLEDLLKRLEVHSLEPGGEGKHIDVVSNLEDKHTVFEEATQNIGERSDEDILKRLAEKHAFLREDIEEPPTRNISAEDGTEKPQQTGSEDLTQTVSASTSTKKDITIQDDKHSPEEMKTQTDTVTSSNLEEDIETDDDILRRLMEKHPFLVDLEEVPSPEDVDLSREALKKALLGQVNMGFSFGSEGVPESCALVSDLLDVNLNREPTDLQLFITHLDEHRGDEEDDALPDLLADGEEEQSDSISLPEEDFLLEAPIPIFEENIVFLDDRYLDREGFVHLPRMNVCGSRIGTSHTVEEPLFPFNEIMKEEELAQKAHVKKRRSH